MKFNKYQYVELQIQPGQANPFFTPQQYLRNRQIFSAEVFTGSDLSGSRSDTVAATTGMIQGMFLNFYCTDVNLPVQAVPNSSTVNGQGWGNWFRDVPLIRLHQVQNGTDPYVREPFELYGEQIDFEQSYLNIDATAQGLITDGGVPVSVIFGFGYK